MPARAILLLLSLVLSACSAIELRQQLANATTATEAPPANFGATSAALEATALSLSAIMTAAAETAAALESTAAALPATPAATSVKISAAAVAVYGSVPVDSDRLNTIAALAFDQDGHLLISTRAGEIYRLRDADADGRADERQLIFRDDADALGQISGMATLGDSIILLNDGNLSQVTDSDGNGRYDAVTDLAAALPAGQTPLLASNGIIRAPDGRLFSADLDTGEILRIILLE